MNSLLLGALVFFILILATMLGMFARSRLPEHHLNSESKDVIRLATAVVGTLSALALGLLIASAKSDYDNAQAEMKTSAARIVLWTGSWPAMVLKRSVHVPYSSK